MEQLDLRLYAILDPENTGPHELLDLARAVAAGGATLVQLRDKMSDTAHMIEAARALRDHGTVPPLVDNPGISTNARSGDLFAPSGQPWLEAYEQTLGQAVHPEFAQAAE